MCPKKYIFSITYWQYRDIMLGMLTHDIRTSASYVADTETTHHRMHREERTNERTNVKVCVRWSQFLLICLQRTFPCVRSFFPIAEYNDRKVHTRRYAKHNIAISALCKTKSIIFGHIEIFHQYFSRFFVLCSEVYHIFYNFTNILIILMMGKVIYIYICKLYLHHHFSV